MSPIRHALALAALAFIPTVALADCDQPADNAETAQCLGEQMHETDQRINAVYKQLMGTLPETGKRDLRAEQRAWLKKRDATCRLDNKETNRERWMQAILADHPKTICVVRFTNLRADELEMMLAAPQEPPATRGWELAEDTYELFAGAPKEKGKWYFEIRVDKGGIARQAETALYMGVFNSESGDMGNLLNIRKRDTNGPTVVYGVAVDLDEGKYYDRYERWNAEPGSSRGSDLKLGRPYDAGVESSVALGPLVRDGLVDVNFGERPFEYPVPNGYRPFLRP